MSRGAIRTLVLVLLVIPLLAAPLALVDGASVRVNMSAPSDPQPDRQARRVWRPDAVRRVPASVSRSAENRYFVTLHDDAPDPGEVADKLARTHGLIVTHVFRVNLSRIIHGGCG